MLKVQQQNKLTRTRKADADRRRCWAALAAVTNKVFVIAGYDNGIQTCLSTVSYYDIASNTWKGLSAKLDIARFGHSACTLN